MSFWIRQKLEVLSFHNVSCYRYFIDRKKKLVFMQHLLPRTSEESDFFTDIIIHRIKAWSQILKIMKNSRLIFTLRFNFYSLSERSLFPSFLLVILSLDCVVLPVSGVFWPFRLTQAPLLVKIGDRVFSTLKFFVLSDIAVVKVMDFLPNCFLWKLKSFLMI